MSAQMLSQHRLPWSALSTLLLMACSPSESRVRDNNGASGPLQNHSIFYQVQVPGENGATTEMKYCVQMGTVVDANTGAYNCNFFEYISSTAGDKMSTEVYAGGKGAPALCQTGNQVASMPFTCVYRYMDTTGKEVRTSCSTKPQSFLVGGQPIMLFTLSNTGGTWTAQGLPQGAQTDAGHAAPAIINAQVVPGVCQNPALAALFPLPPSAEALQQPPAAGGTTNPNTNPSTPGANVVSYQLNIATAPRGSAIKTSTAQASDLAEGSTKCTLSPTTVTLKAELDPGLSAAPIESKHYRLAKLVSVQIGSVPMCESFVGKSVYIFSDHWTAQTTGTP